MFPATLSARRGIQLHDADDGVTDTSIAPPPRFAEPEPEVAPPLVLSTTPAPLPAPRRSTFGIVTPLDRMREAQDRFTALRDAAPPPIIAPPPPPVRHIISEPPPSPSPSTATGYSPASPLVREPAPALNANRSVSPVESPAPSAQLAAVAAPAALAGAGNAALPGAGSAAVAVASQLGFDWQKHGRWILVALAVLALLYLTRKRS